MINIFNTIVKCNGKLPLEQYLENTMPYAHDMINYVKRPGGWKIPITKEN